MVAASTEYPFLKTPPMLEMLRDDFDRKSRHVSHLPAFVTNDSEKQSFFREQVLVHSTQGNLAHARDAVRLYRLDGQSMEADLRGLAADSSMPDTKRKQLPGGDD